MDTIKPKEAGFSTQRLSRINTVMQSYLDQGKLAGMLTMVARRGKIAHCEKFGMMDIEAGKPMQFDTLFRIYSMTKPITSTAVMMLYEEGRFRLYDPVSQYIPGFKDVKVFVKKTETGIELADLKREITIRDLLTHTAGLSYGWDENPYIKELYNKRVWDLVSNKPGTTLETTVQELVKIPLLFQPGSTFRYSIATDVLGYLVQVVSGMPFEVFLKQRIFEPLGMVDTDFYVPEQKIGRFAANYERGEKGELKLNDSPATSHYTKPATCPLGGAGLVSTAADYIRFAQMLLNKGELDGVRLLGRKMVELMTMNHLPEGVYCDAEKARGFGLGFGVLVNMANWQAPGSLGNYGWSGAANTYFWIDPVEELIGLLMAQFMPNEFYPVSRDFNAMVYQALVD